MKGDLIEGEAKRSVAGVLQKSTIEDPRYELVIFVNGWTFTRGGPVGIPKRESNLDRYRA